jgi:2-keto-4-pentenoate hydratase/2-oxohepta-3-ene-1,7-dioic acid hydratase in catechol pathway
MRVGTIRREGRHVGGVLAPKGQTATLLASTDERDPLLALLRDPRGLTAAVESAVTDTSVDVGPDDLAAPIRRPGKVIAIGLNYVKHTAETGLAAPDRPLTFAKYPSSVVGPFAEIRVPSHITQHVDYEGELAIVIGRDCRPDGTASLADVAGYCVANDVSARDVQFGDGQWTRAKSFDTFTPLGPWLVTPDEVPDLAVARISTAVNGDLRQDDTIKSMAFDIAAILAFVSDGITLEAGDVILTGTPSGAGGFLDPPRYLADGDTVEVSIEGLGSIRNVVRIPPEASPFDE